MFSGRSSVSSGQLADHMRIRYDELKDFVQIGQGGFSNVFKARWQVRCAFSVVACVRRH